MAYNPPESTAIVLSHEEAAARGYYHPNVKYVQVERYLSADTFSAPATWKLLGTSTPSIVTQCNPSGSGSTAIKPPGYELWACGQWATYVPTEQGAVAEAFGCVPDAVYNFNAGTVTGTDNTAAFKNFFSYLLYFGKCDGIMNGRYYCSGSLEFGLGLSFFTGPCRLKGAGPLYNGYGSSQGSIIYTGSDEYGINCQGYRNISFENFVVQGLNKNWIDLYCKLTSQTPLNTAPYNDPVGNPTQWKDPLLPQSYLSPNLSLATLLRYRPYSGIVLDARQGTKPVASAWAPSTAYSGYDGVTNDGNLYVCLTAGTSAGSGGPTGTSLAITDGTCLWGYCGPDTTSYGYSDIDYDADYPWARYLLNGGSAISQYNKGIGSRMSRQRQDNLGFVVGWMINPSNNNSGTDFSAKDTSIDDACIWQISIGGSQARELRVSNCGAGRCWRGIASNRHGRREGAVQLRGSSIDLSYCVAGYFDIQNASNAGDSTISTANIEMSGTLGEYGRGSVSGSLTIDGLQIVQYQQNDWLGYRAFISTGSRTILNLSGTLNWAPGGYSPIMFNCVPSNTSLDVHIERPSSAPYIWSQDYQKLFNDATVGCLLFSQLGTTARNQKVQNLRVSTYPYFDLDGSSADYSSTITEEASTQKKYPVCIWSRWGKPSSQNEVRYQVPTVFTLANLATDMASTPTLVNGVLTLVFNTLSDSTANQYGPLPGDQILIENANDARQNTHFMVYSRSTTTVLARQMNNCRVIGGTFNAQGFSTGGGTITTITPFTYTSGYATIGNNRLYYPSYPYIASTTSGSNSMSVGLADGSTTGISTELPTGVIKWSNVQIDYRFTVANSAVSSGGSSPLTMAGNSTKTTTDEPIGWFIRPGAANGTPY